MERLNEIMGRTMPRRLSNPTQQLHPYQEHDLAAQIPQTEPASRPVAHRRSVEQAPESLPPNSSMQPQAPYPYGNGTSSRPDQPYYSSTTRNQRQSYTQEVPHSRFNEPGNYARPYAEIDGPEAQTFANNVYRQNVSTAYPSTGRINEMNDGDMMYNPNAQFSTQYRQNYAGSQSRQEQYFHRSDVTHHIAQPEADVLDTEETEDDDVLYMRDGDWEEDSNQILPYRRPETGSRAQTRRLTGIHEPVPAYIEQPTQSGHATRNLYDIRNGAGDNKRPSPAYRTQQSTEQPSQRYPVQQVAPLPPVQPTTYIPQGQPAPSARQGRSPQAQPPHPGSYEQEAPYSQRTTQPLNAQTLMNLTRQREYASPLNQARMRQAEPPQQVQTAPQTERKGTQTTARIHSVQPTRQVSQAQPAQSAPFVFNKPLCTICRGAGYLRANVPFGHPNFGKAIACECKEAERKEKRRQQLREISNLDAFRQKTFNTFNVRLSGVQEAYQAALDFETNPKGWLVLCGPNGCGKTHLAAAIANQALDNGAVVLFEATPDLLDHLRAAFAPAANEVYDQLFSKMREAELLILDDLGAQQSSPWANEKLFQLLNYRYNLSMATVITGNPKGIQGVDERIRSRLSDSGLVRTINMDRAQDYRPRNPHRS
jgi:DNA replication protein DnaC